MIKPIECYLCYLPALLVLLLLNACTNNSGGHLIYKNSNTDSPVALYYLSLKKQANYGQASVQVDNSRHYNDRKIGTALWRYNLNKELKGVSIAAHDFESQSGVQRRLHLNDHYELIVLIQCKNKHIAKRLQKINFSPSEFPFEPNNKNYIDLIITTDFCNNPRYDKQSIDIKSAK